MSQSLPSHLPRRMRNYLVLCLLAYVSSYWIGNTLVNVESLYSIVFPPSYPPLKNVVDGALDEEVSNFLLSVQSLAIKRPNERSRKKTLQSALMCSAKTGSWKLAAPFTESWPIFVPNAHCPGAYSNSTPTGKRASTGVCEYLSGKNVLFVGPETTFFLHSLWLASLEAYESRLHTCPGIKLCTFHHICRGASSLSEALELSDGTAKMPSQNMLQATSSSLLQYALSSTLQISRKDQDEIYAVPTSVADQGLRMSEIHWLKRARNTDILVINRGPIPVPAMDGGNDVWAFTEKLCEQRSYFDALHCHETLESRLVNAALHATINLFLPAVLESLETIKRDPDMSESSLIWHSSWFIQPTCAVAELPPSIPLLREFWSGKSPCMVDPRSFYYNSQVYMHDRLLPPILEHFNFTYIPLTVPAYPKPASVRFVEPDILDYEDQLGKPKDCLRYPWPTFGADTLEVVFFSALGKILDIF